MIGCQESRAESGVDSFELGQGLILQHAVCRQLAPGRRRNLQKRYFAAQVRAGVEKDLDRMKPLEDALREIPTLDTESQRHVVADAIATPYFDTRQIDRRQRVELARRPFDGDGVGCDMAHVPLQGHGHVLVIDLALHEPIDRGQEVLAVIAGVETEDVGAQQMQQHLVLPRTDSEGLGVGPGYVPEQDDGGIRLAIADEFRQQREVIVLDQHHRIAFAGLPGHDGRELLVDRAVGIPVTLAEGRPDVREMT